MSLFALNSAVQEYSMMKKCQHSNVLKCLGYFEDLENMVIVYELMDSDIRSLLVELDFKLKEDQIKQIFY